MLKFHGWARISNTPVIKTIPDTNVKVAHIPVAVNEKGNQANPNPVSFFTLEVWDSAAEYVENHAAKGDLICFDGKLKQDRWTDNEGKNQSKYVFRVEQFRIEKYKPADNNAGVNT